MSANCNMIEETTKKLTQIIKTFGPMSLDEAKEFYERENATNYPLGAEYDEYVRYFLIDWGLKVTEEDEKTFFENDSFKRKMPSPILDDSINSIRKRTRSESRVHQEEKENECSYTLSTRGRCLQRVSFLPKTSSPIKIANRSQSLHRPKKHYPSIEGCVLVGDDLIIGYVKFNMKEELPRVDNKLSSGLCISGLTIAQATEELKRSDDLPFPRILVYLGSSDILKRRQLVQMMCDFDKFVKVCEKKEIRVVACTLAPILGHDEFCKEILEGFNKYLNTRANVSVIDVHSAFIQNDRPNAAYYSRAIKTSGQMHQMRFWTNRGRLIFEQTIMCNLGFALLDEKPCVHSRKIN